MNTENQLKIYFAASIRGGRENQQSYEKIISCIQQKAQVLTEHIGSASLTHEGESGLSDKEIFERDIAFIEKAHAVIAEVTIPSLGVGYELGFAQATGKPVLCLYNTNAEKPLSAMIAGNAYFGVNCYDSLPDACAAIEDFLRNI